MKIHDNQAVKHIYHDGNEKFEIKLALLYLQVYDDRVVMTYGNNARTMMFSEIDGIRIVTAGKREWWYMEIDYPGLPRGVKDVTKFEFHPQYNDKMIEIKNYIQQRVIEIGMQSEFEEKKRRSAADELMKLKQLLDMGVITKEEFEGQKKKLLC